MVAETQKNIESKNNNPMLSEYTRLKTSKKIRVITAIDIMFFLIIFVTMDYTTMKTDYLLYAMIGLLTFVAIFYGLIFQEPIKNKLQETNDIFNKRILEISNNFEQQKALIKDTKKLRKEIDLVDEKISNNKMIKSFMQIHTILYITAITLIVGILSIVLNFPTGISAVMLCIGATLTVQILNLWAFVIQK